MRSATLTRPTRPTRPAATDEAPPAVDQESHAAPDPHADTMEAPAAVSRPTPPAPKEYLLPEGVRISDIHWTATRKEPVLEQQADGTWRPHEKDWRRNPETGKPEERIPWVDWVGTWDPALETKGLSQSDAPEGTREPVQEGEAQGPQTGIPEPERELTPKERRAQAKAEKAEAKAQAKAEKAEAKAQRRAEKGSRWGLKLLGTGGFIALAVFAYRRHQTPNQQGS